MKSDYKNILIVRTDRIGDVALTIPSITALRQHYPSAKISILVAPLTRELVDGNSCLDEVIVDDREGEHKGFGFLNLHIKFYLNLQEKIKSQNQPEA